ncbi:hypothetical protein F6X51_18790 [Methylobacterium planeticum]|uniref:Uncharacterized protein n=2 Tax=Methylobacterium planeticum TaxID=2615211 RepID=A0A6N6MKH0_9HYPH|nr:hypothetical protein F6X51_18790 [Methylobacterium planeticum]
MSAGLGAALLLAPSAQAYEWGGGSCVGYGCVRALHEDGYRPARAYRYEERRPDVRIIERRRDLRDAEDWDEDEED